MTGLDRGALDRALERGEIDEAGWFQRMLELEAAACLGADTVYEGAGHPGSPAEWEEANRLLVGALHKSGSFLDVGCANGLLMESLAAWAQQAGRRIDPHGLEMSPELVQVARSRLPHWAGRIHAGNVLHWEPPQRYTFVRTCLDYVPRTRRAELVQRILDDFLEPGGRLLLGVLDQERTNAVAAQIQAWGFYFGGVVQAPQRPLCVLWLEL